MIDLEKRKRVMGRSMKLGHCICNPKLACPCPAFTAKNICSCAGERDGDAIKDARLTRLVEKAGCASKISQDDLKKVLSGLPPMADPRVLVGSNTCDDAGVYVLDDKTALVQTVDVFSPSVDDPYTFGQVAAANSLSDVYAMGGRPLTALSVIGFPIETLSHEVMTRMLRGGQDKMNEAGVAVVGGHSINDKEPKFGYAVTGVVDPSRVVTNAGAKPGDALVLTKPLGVGVISFAAQMGIASDAAMAAASRSMTELNKTAAEVMVELGVTSATDVTGFGLLGHLGEMVTQSGVTAEIDLDAMPVFDEAMDYISRGVVSGGAERNREHVSELVKFAEAISEDTAYVLYDPQTSGGLLIAVAEDRAEALVSELRKRGVPAAALIGRITGKSDGNIVVRAGHNRPTSILCDARSGGSPCPPEEEAMEEQNTACCCGDGATPGTGDLPALNTGEGSLHSQQRFGAFMNSVYADGTINSRTKELMAIALSVLSKCEPCVKIHIEEARSQGASEEEITEAVWMAISFGGAPVMMFYRTMMEKAQ